MKPGGAPQNCFSASGVNLPNYCFHICMSAARMKSPMHAPCMRVCQAMSCMLSFKWHRQSTDMWSDSYREDLKDRPHPCLQRHQAHSEGSPCCCARVRCPTPAPCPFVSSVTADRLILVIQQCGAGNQVRTVLADNQPERVLAAASEGYRQLSNELERSRCQVIGL